MKRLLYCPSDIHNGDWYYRCIRPLEELNKMFPGEWDITVSQAFKWDDVNYLKKFDLIVVHGGAFAAEDQDLFWSFLVWAKNEGGPVTCLDIDDYWEYGKEHPLNIYNVTNAIAQKTLGTVSLCDFVTTTTERFADIIRQYNKNVFIMPNSLCADDTQFTVKKRVTPRLKFGLAGGSSHVNDIRELINDKECFIDYMTNAQRDKMQIVLCGFDTRSTMTIVDSNGNVVEKRDNTPEETWWTKIERKLTHDYKDVSDEYRKLLLKYDRSDEAYDASDEPYKRVWTKKIWDDGQGDYGKIYEDIDVLMVPLRDTQFNRCKSELKQIEAGWTCSACMCSDVPPYNDWGTEADTIFVGKGPKAWAREIKKLLRDPKIYETKANILRDRVLKERDTKKLTAYRHEVYMQMMTRQ